MKLAARIPRILVITVLALSACLPSASIRVARSGLSRDMNPNVSQDDLSSLVAGNNAFALDLYQALRSGTGNMVFSPYSISLALAMTYAGANGATGSQMADVLHFTLPQDRLHQAFNQLDLGLTTAGQPVSKDGQPLQLDIANAVWAEQTLSFQQGYLDLIARNYGAAVQLADFVNRSEAVRSDINRWVSDQTRQKIRDLIPEGALDSMTRLVLVNAIYFKGDWERQFDPANTQDAQFHLLDGSNSKVKMMLGDFSGLLYSTGDGYQAVELNYSGDTAAMDIIVPDDGNFNEFESQLNSQKLDEILAGMHPAALSLGLPKFSFETGFDLDQGLSRLGMPNAFDPNLADFSGITGKHDLVISKVLHRALVTVDEKGTEAAAATSVIMSTTSILQQRVTLTIDRPFIFIIRDTVNKQILFGGRVLDPTK